MGAEENEDVVQRNHNDRGRDDRFNRAYGNVDQAKYGHAQGQGMRHRENGDYLERIEIGISGPTNRLPDTVLPDQHSRQQQGQ